MCLPKDRAIGRSECRASGENHAVTRRYLSVARRSDDRFHERGRNDHSRPQCLPPSVTQTSPSPEISERFSLAVSQQVAPHRAPSRVLLQLFLSLPFAREAEAAEGP